MRFVAMDFVSMLAAGNAVADDFACRISSITDGDTFRCDDGTRVHGLLCASIGCVGMSTYAVEIETGPEPKGRSPKV